MVMYAKVRRMFLREHLSINEITRRTSLSRNTIKKWLKTQAEPKYKHREVVTKLTAFESQLKLMLESNAHRPKKERRTALALFTELKSVGFTGSYSRITQYIRQWRNQSAKVTGKSAFVPLKFELGEAFQFDWSEEDGLFIGGQATKIQAAHLKLCASRAFAVFAYPTQTHEMLFEAHTRSFNMLGGITMRGIYDNMKTAVNKVAKGKQRIVNTRFAAMTAHYLFDPDFCNVASGWEKGVVEKNVQDSRSRIWQEARKQHYASFDELNSWLESHCKELWSTLLHPEYDALTLAEVLEHERPHLMPVPTPFDGYVEVLARVSSTCLITIHRNKYSVPCHLANKIIDVHLYPQTVKVYSDTHCVAQHNRSFGRHQTFYNWEHYLPLVERKPGVLKNGAPFATMPTALITLQTALIRHEGGDKQMAKVLSAIPIYGLEAVLVAVELALESGAPLAEHVQNILGRLMQNQKPDSVETALQLQESPQADTKRYELLYRLEVTHV
jgi:transposase